MGRVRPSPPRLLTADDDISQFSSGEPSLDHYLSVRAVANHNAGFARCYVTTDMITGAVIGYYTLSAIAIEHRNLPGKFRRNAPNPVPAVLLGRLAVDITAQGMGLGRDLIHDAILRTLEAADAIGVRILVVHALNERAAAFYELFDFKRSPTDPLHLYLSPADARMTLEATSVL